MVRFYIQFLTYRGRSKNVFIVLFFSIPFHLGSPSYLFFFQLEKRKDRSRNAYCFFSPQKRCLGQLNPAKRPHSTWVRYKGEKSVQFLIRVEASFGPMFVLKGIRPNFRTGMKLKICPLQQINSFFFVYRKKIVRVELLHTIQSWLFTRNILKLTSSETTLFFL